MFRDYFKRGPTLAARPAHLPPLPHARPRSGDHAGLRCRDHAGTRCPNVPGLSSAGRAKRDPAAASGRCWAASLAMPGLERRSRCGGPCASRSPSMPEGPALDALHEDAPLSPRSVARTQNTPQSPTNHIYRWTSEESCSTSGSTLVRRSTSGASALARLAHEYRPPSPEPEPD